jgi:hypothetical protein
MSDSHAEMQKREQSAALTAPVSNDGWGDAATEAAERTIRGTLLKFADWRWTAGKEATPIEDGTKLVAMATAAMWVRWEDNKPVELRAAKMPTKRGPKSKPVFKVVGWKSASGGEQPAPVERQITAKQANEEVYRREMDDEIPW